MPKHRRTRARIALQRNDEISTPTPVRKRPQSRNTSPGSDKFSSPNSTLSPGADGRRSSPRIRARRSSNSSTEARHHGHSRDDDLHMMRDGDRTRDNFEDLFAGSEIIQIDPESCLPFVSVRSICKSGVGSLIAAFEGRSGAPGQSRGHSSAGGLPVVVKIPENMTHMVIDHLMERYQLSESDAKEKAGRTAVWYGMIDGSHRLAALMNLIEINPETYKGYKWWVTRINSVSMDRLKAFACSRNEFQRKDHIVDFTVYDVLVNMRETAVSLALDRGAVLGRQKKLPHGFLKDLADKYCGGKDCASDTIRQMAGVVVKLSTDVIETIGDIVNEECPELAKKAQMKKNRRNKTKYIDGRAFRKTINTYTLRGATKFLTTREDADRINALYRVKYLAQEYNYKGTPREILEQQVERAIAARVEAEKFETMLGTDEWPEQMKLFRNNLLRTTKLDAEVERNDGNDNVLLPSAAKLYRELYKSVALHNIQAWSRRSHSAAYNENGTVEGYGPDSDARNTPEADKIHSNRRNEVTEDANGGSPDYQPPPNNAESQPLQRTADHCLHLGIQALQSTFDSYDSQWCEGAVRQFDLILGDPSSTGCFPGDPTNGKVLIDDKSMDEFAQFACRVLATGGYLFMFTNMDYYGRWKQVLSSRGFEVMPDPFFIIRDSETVQSTNSRRWPQNIAEFAIVAQTSGDHPTDFKIDLETPYLQIPKNAHKRKFAAITHAPAASSKLKRTNRRSLVRPSERAPQLISEIITTFCPPGGRVLDPFASVFTTGIACLATERPCTLLETDPECFRLAKKRLEMLASIFSREYASSPQQRNRKRQRHLTSPEELESLNRVLRHMETTFPDDSCMGDEAPTDDGDARIDDKAVLHQTDAEQSTDLQERSPLDV